MKGVKKCFGVLLVLFITFLFSFGNSLDAFAVNPNTNKINFYMRQHSEQSYSWSQYVDSGYSNRFYSVDAVRQYGIQYDNIYTTGNYASLHFETNIVAVAQSLTQNDSTAFRWLNLDRIVVKHCTFSGSPLIIETNNIETVITEWWQETSNNYWSYSSTLTLYGDVTLSGIPANTGGTFVCDVGTDVNNDYFWSDESLGSMIYWEKNPSNMIFGSSLNDSLLQTQINQNNTVINQNQEIIDRDSEDRDELQNTSDSAESTASSLGTDVSNRSASFITIIGNFINVVLHPPQSDCKIDGNMGHMDLGQIDLCELSPPPAISVIGSFILIGILIPLIMAVLYRFIGLLRRINL